MSTRITQNQRVLFGPVTGRNKKTGDLEPLDGPATAVSTRANIVTIEPYTDAAGAVNTDFFYAQATGALDPDDPASADKLTTVPINVSADADVGPGVRTIQRQIILEVVDAGAGDLDVPAGQPEDLP